MRKEFLGVDLGSDKTSIYSFQQNRVIFSEATAIAYEKTSKEVTEVGFLAEKIRGKTPFHYQVIHPVINGLIYDDDAAYDFLNTVLSRVGFSKRKRGVNIMFTAPSNCGKVHKKMLLALAKKLGFKNVYIESQAKLSGIGIGEISFAPVATLIADIGSGITDIALLSMGEVVTADSTAIAGDTFDEAIRRYVIQKQHLKISLKTAEYIKMKIGSIRELSENRLVEIKGRDTVTSLPSSILISSGEIKNVLLSLVNYISLKITDVIAATPSDLVADLTKNGLILSGGGALLPGLKEYFQKSLSIPVKLVDRPQEAIIEGFKNLIPRLIK